MKNTRRALLKSLVFGGGSPSLVVVFLRGGVDGLNLVIPHFESEYYAIRPTLALKDTIKLDDRFGFNVNLRPLDPLYREGRLAVVHAVGSDDTTRSHFEAQDLMERAGASGGWVGRYLRARKGEVGALSAVSITPTLPESLRGAPSAAAMESIEEAALPDASDAFTKSLRVLYESDGSAVGRAGLTTLEVLDKVNRMKSAPMAEMYPDTGFGRRMREVARLLKADVGLEVACLEVGGWDTHYVQAPLLTSLASELSGGLAAFAKDLGSRMDRTMVVAMTEFGRRSYENGTFGTDHGRASVMFAMGGPVHGGRVITDWPGLGKEDLDGGDLKVTIDYRDILGEVVSRGLGHEDLTAVFPGTKPRFHGLMKC